MELYVRVAIGGVLMPTLRAWMEYHFELGNLRISNYYCYLNRTLTCTCSKWVAGVVVGVVVDVVAS